eukprot:1371507-Pyramimonas_sp.AAC.1
MASGLRGPRRRRASGIPRGETGERHPRREGAFGVFGAGPAGWRGWIPHDNRPGLVASVWASLVSA